jgi:hypothetical protein
MMRDREDVGEVIGAIGRSSGGIYPSNLVDGKKKMSRFMCFSLGVIFLE